VVFTHSRGAALALAGSLLVIAYYSKRRILILIGLAILTVPAVYLVRASYVERMETLQDPASETSARERIENTKIAFRMALEHPLVGVGFGTMNEVKMWRRYTSMPLPRTNGTYIHGTYIDGMVIHDTYLQMLTDSGVPAAILYVVVLWGTIFWLHRSAKRMLLRESRFAAYPMAILTSLVAFAIGSVFLSRVAFDAEYILLMCAAAWWNLEPGCLEEAEEEQVSYEEETSMSFAGEPAEA